jgi:cytochrome c-type biogenesis protein CcmH
MRNILLAVFMMMGLVLPAMAAMPDEMLADAALESRARHLAKQLRCVVCQNETIDESHSPLARDMRQLVRQRLLAGDNDQAVIDYLVARYGEFVLLRPRVEPATYVLWGLPFVLLAGGVFFILRRARPNT